MPSSDTPQASANTQTNANTVPFVPPQLLLSLATAPMLLALIGGKVLTEAVHELGVFSEELFRGDRLPVLHFPSETDPNPDDRTSL